MLATLERGLGVCITCFEREYGGGLYLDLWSLPGSE